MKKDFYLKYKKYILCVVLICSIFIYGCERYWEKKINDFPNTVWISKSPYLKITVDENGQMNGETVYKKEKVKVTIRLRNNAIRCFINNKNDVEVYFAGEYTFSKNRCIIIIDEKEGMLEGVDEIVLYNQNYVEKRK